MPDIQTDLAEILIQVDRPGNYYASGRQEIHTPRLEVEGVGTIALPLLPIQAEQIRAVAEQAPYGRGSETLVDTGVRRTWQVDGQRVRIGGRCWEGDLGRILQQVTRSLGINSRVRAELYKLLMYEQGDFFVPHRDTEKAPGMFATLVIVLPCDFRGGELLVRHCNDEVRIDLRPADPSEALFAAFYADCRHEVLPVTSGQRLTLIYNLLRDNGGNLPQAPDYRVQQREVEERLRQWVDTADGPSGGPDKLVYPLEHAYTQAELGFDTLKGADAAVAAVVIGACESADCDCHLALLTIEESGWAEYAGGGWDGEEEDYEIGEVTDDSWSLQHWRHPDGSRPPMGTLPFHEQEISPLEALDDLEETEPEFEEASGNAGVSFERFYQRAALVLWPRANRGKVVTAGGLEVSVPFLSELVRRWEEDGRSPEDKIRQEALALAEQIRHAWPTHEWGRKGASESGHGRSLLEGLARLGDLEQRRAFLTEQILDGAYGPADNPAVASLLGQLPPEQAGELLRALVSSNGARQSPACANLLLLCTKEPSMSSEYLQPAATLLINALSADEVRTGVVETFGVIPPESPTPALVTDSLSALEAVDPALAGKALERFLTLPEVYSIDDLLLPAALALGEARSKAEPASFAGLRHAVLTHLQRRIHEPLEAPADWTRPADVTCTCNHCFELNRFLSSRDTPEWGLKAAEAKRRHVEAMVSRHRCDLDLTTDKRGRPYTLVCTKNQASYERRIRQRKRDLEHRAKLRE